MKRPTCDLSTPPYKHVDKTTAQTLWSADLGCSPCCNEKLTSIEHLVWVRHCAEGFTYYFI